MSQASPRARRLRSSSIITLTLAGFGLLAFSLAGLFAASTIRGLDQPAAAAAVERPSVVFVTADGEPFARRGARRDAPVTLAGLPAYVPQALIAVEDRRFYEHHGVDLRGTLRAALVDVRRGGAAQGGSTITQQLVKTTFFDSQRSLRRKAQEAVAAVWLEQRLSKEAILERYLNTVYFGEGAYGLAAASQTYFDKPAEELTLSEAAMLAGLVKAPSQLAPHGHLAAAQARERLVLAAMVDAGYLSPAIASATPVAEPRAPQIAGNYGGHFADWLYASMANRLTADGGQVTVRTTLDAELQKRAEWAVHAALQRQGGGGPHQAALVAMRRDGQVVAMVGGDGYDASPFNRATQARRQPGSTFKLFVYLAAFRRGAAPDSLVSDEPLRIGNWTPANADRENHGVLTLEEAFARSSNLAAIRVSETVGRGEVIQAARDLGITTPLQDVPSLPLGTSGVSLLELTGAYAAVAAGAYPVHPVGVLDAPAAQARTPMDWQNERAPLLQLLHAAASRIGPTASYDLPVYGKTGTTQKFRDAVFVGFAGDLVVGVWVGNDDEAPMDRVSGSTLPASIWRTFMQGAATDESAAGFAADPGPPAEASEGLQPYDPSEPQEDNDPLERLLGFHAQNRVRRNLREPA